MWPKTCITLVLCRPHITRGFLLITAIFFNLILGLSAASTVIQVVVINVFYQEDKDVPKWMMNFIIKPICVITFVKLPLHQNRSCCFKQVSMETCINLSSLFFVIQLYILEDITGKFMFDINFHKQTQNRLEFKQWWKSIPPISTKRTITSHLNWTHWKQKGHDIWCWKSKSWLATGTNMWRC